MTRDEIHRAVAGEEQALFLRVVANAELHGMRSGDGEYTLGDLEEALSICLRTMTEKQRRVAARVMESARLFDEEDAGSGDGDDRGAAELVAVLDEEPEGEYGAV